MIDSLEGITDKSLIKGVAILSVLFQLESESGEVARVTLHTLRLSISSPLPVVAPVITTPGRDRLSSEQKLRRGLSQLLSYLSFSA